jgi:hypothetical protein
MKSNLKKFAKTAAIGLALVFTFTGCAYHRGEPIGTVYQIGGPVKEVEVIGMIHVKCMEGEPVYQALMRAAEAKGGNGIANVVIDIEHIQVRSGPLNWSESNIKYGSALAIKYTNQNIVADKEAKEGKLGIPSNLTSPYGYGQAINATPK